jgi:hypothetical protein
MVSGNTCFSAVAGRMQKTALDATQQYAENSVAIV